MKENRSFIIYWDYRFLSWRKSKAIVVFVRDDVNKNPRDYSAIENLTLDKKQGCSSMQGNTKR